jgi:hypothetical protein
MITVQDQVEVAVVSSSGDIEAAFKHLRSLSSNISSPISERKRVWLSANMWILYPPSIELLVLDVLIELFDDQGQL